MNHLIRASCFPFTFLFISVKRSNTTTGTTNTASPASGKKRVSDDELMPEEPAAKRLRSKEAVSVDINEPVVTTAATSKNKSSSKNKVMEILSEESPVPDSKRQRLCKANADEPTATATDSSSSSRKTASKARSASLSPNAKAAPVPKQRASTRIASRKAKKSNAPKAKTTAASSKSGRTAEKAAPKSEKVATPVRRSARLQAQTDTSPQPGQLWRKIVACFAVICLVLGTGLTVWTTARPVFAPPYQVPTEMFLGVAACNHLKIRPGTLLTDNSIDSAVTKVLDSKVGAAGNGFLGFAVGVGHSVSLGAAAMDLKLRVDNADSDLYFTRQFYAFGVDCISEKFYTCSL